MKPKSVFRWNILLLTVILLTQTAFAALVDISAHFTEAAYIGQYEQLPGESQVATFSIMTPGTVTITAEWSTWYPEIGFGRLGIVWKNPDGSWTDNPPFGEILSQVFTSNGRTIEQRDDAKHAPLKMVITYRVSNLNLPLDGYQVAMQRPNFWEGSHSQKAQDSHMIMDFTADAGTGTTFEFSPSLSLGKLIFAPGEEISVSFKAPASYVDNAWVGIIPSSVVHGNEVTNDQNDSTYQYLKKKTSGTLLFSAPQQNGSYDFRMNDNDANGREVASVSFTVGKTSANTLTLARMSFQPGESITLQFSTSLTLPANAWIGIIPSSVAHGSEATNDQNDLTYQYLQGKTAGSMTFTAPTVPGSYDFRMNDTDANGIETAAVSFTVALDASNSTMPVSDTSLAGTWRIAANKTPGTLEFTRQGDSWAGRLKFDVLGKWEELAKIFYGSVSGEWRIRFLRPMGGFDQQMHTGILNGDKMKGTFTQANCVGDVYQWEATRVK